MFVTALIAKQPWVSKKYEEIDAETNDIAIIIDGHIVTMIQHFPSV